MQPKTITIKTMVILQYLYHIRHEQFCPFTKIKPGHKCLVCQILKPIFLCLRISPLNNHHRQRHINSVIYFPWKNWSLPSPKTRMELYSFLLLFMGKGMGTASFKSRQWDGIGNLIIWVPALGPGLRSAYTLSCNGSGMGGLFLPVCGWEVPQTSDPHLQVAMSSQQQAGSPSWIFCQTFGEA